MTGASKIDHKIDTILLRRDEAIVRNNTEEQVATEQQYIKLLNQQAKLAPEKLKYLFVPTLAQETYNWLELNRDKYKSPAELQASVEGFEKYNLTASTAKNRLRNFFLIVEQIYAAKSDVVQLSQTPNLDAASQCAVVFICRELIKYREGKSTAGKGIIAKAKLNGISLKPMIPSTLELTLAHQLGATGLPVLLFEGVAHSPPMQEPVKKTKVGSKKQPKRRLIRKLTRKSDAKETET